MVDYFIVGKSENPHGFKWFFEILRVMEKKIDAKMIRSKFSAKSSRLPIEPPFWDVFVYRIYHPALVASKRRKGSILHIPVQTLSYVIKEGIDKPVVVSCLDVINFLPNARELTNINYDRKFSECAVAGLRLADKIVVPSYYTKDELVRFVGVSPEKIEVIYLGVNHTIYKPQRVEFEDVRGWGFVEGKKNLLYVGTEAPRKNLEGILRALSILVENGVDVNFVKVGEVRRRGHKSLEKLVKELKIQDRVHFVGSVSEEILPQLYSYADAFVFPSFYEGFGLPPLEAMACGCPVITSNLTSLPEVVGDAGVMVDPYNVEALAEAIHSVLTQESVRERLIKAGLERAKMFNWNKTAEQTLKVYQNLVKC